MKVALFQTRLAWENPEANRKSIEEYFLKTDKSFDLFVLPEMFTSGFTMNPGAVSETMDGETMTWLQSLAKTKACAIIGSLVIQENGNFYNRMVFVFPTGEVEFYDKRHLFSLAGEDKVYTRGNDKKVIRYLGWKICPFICYDLRFPVFSRFNDDYDLLIYVANWPQPRINAWDALLKARAIENMSYVVGVNRIGEDENNNSYPGHSQVLDCFGNYMIAPSTDELIATVELEKETMLASRNKFGFLRDRDAFTLTE